MGERRERGEEGRVGEGKGGKETERKERSADQCLIAFADLAYKLKAYHPPPHFNQHRLVTLSRLQLTGSLVRN